MRWVNRQGTNRYPQNEKIGEFARTIFKYVKRMYLFSMFFIILFCFAFLSGETYTHRERENGKEAKNE